MTDWLIFLGIVAGILAVFVYLVITMILVIFGVMLIMEPTYDDDRSKGVKALRRAPVWPLWVLFTVLNAFRLERMQE